MHEQDAYRWPSSVAAGPRGWRWTSRPPRPARPGGTKPATELGDVRLLRATSCHGRLLRRAAGRSPAKPSCAWSSPAQSLAGRADGRLRGILGSSAACEAPGLPLGAVPLGGRVPGGVRSARVQGFDAIAGNPPFAGKNTVAVGNVGRLPRLAQAGRTPRATAMPTSWPTSSAAPSISSASRAAPSG